MTARPLVIALLLVLLGAAPARADGAWGSVSAYCETGTMADGDRAAWGAAAGAAWLPFGSVVRVPGYGRVLVEDRGRPGLFTLDLAMPGDCPAAWQWGRQYLPLRVLRWGWDGLWLR